MSQISAPVLSKRGSSYSNPETRGYFVKKYTESTGKTTTYLPEKHSTVKIDIGRFEGFDISNYHKRVKEGKILPMTPFKQFFCKGECEGSYSMTYTNDNILYYSDTYAPCVYWQITEDELAEYAPQHSKNYADMAAARIKSNGFDMLTFMAELADVKRLLLSIGKTCRSLFASRSFKDLASEYLGYRYGWRPLVSELTELYDIIQNWDKVQRKRWNQRCGNAYSFTEVNTIVDTGSYFSTEYTISDDVTVSERGNVVADIVVPTLQFNPVATAWELVPLSFVLDWVVSVGQAISVASFLVSVEAYAASCGYHMTVRRNLTCETIGPYSDNYASGGVEINTASCAAELSVRNPCKLSFSPHFMPNLNALKVADLIALITQRMK